MSGNEEEDDKITVLFPDRQDGESEKDEDSEAGDEEAEKETGPDRESDESGEVGPDPDRESTGEDEDEASEETGESAEDEDNVVRLDFQDKAGGPSSPGDRQAGPMEGLPSDEAVDSEEAKFEVFRRMIEEGMVMVTLDTRVDGVDVPPKFEGLPELRLNFSHMFHIDDFDYDEEGVRASLSFDGSRYFCQVPWDAVFMVYSHESGDVVVFDPAESPSDED